MTGTARVLPSSSEATFAAAVHALENDRVVAIPTDTVYGLAVRFDRPDAIAALFRSKKRPDNVPLPVLVSGEDQAASLAVMAREPTTLLVGKWWPGPLTIVVPDLRDVGTLLGATGSVGLRAPEHGFVRSLCEAVGPLAVTSANLHGEAPGTEAVQVASTFSADEVGLVVDGGHCSGLPSTVVDCTVTPPVCLREGGILWEAIAAMISSA